MQKQTHSIDFKKKDYQSFLNEGSKILMVQHHKNLHINDIMVIIEVMADGKTCTGNQKLFDISDIKTPYSLEKIRFSFLYLNEIK